MSLRDPLRQSRELLQIDEDSDPQAIKRAYRRLIAEHPPDRDPERFQEIRAAYERLLAPRAHAEATLIERVPHAPAPAAPAVAPLPRGAVAASLLRALVAALPLSLPEP